MSNAPKLDRIGRAGLERNFIEFLVNCPRFIGQVRGIIKPTHLKNDALREDYVQLLLGYNPHLNYSKLPIEPNPDTRFRELLVCILMANIQECLGTQDFEVIIHLYQSHNDILRPFVNEVVNFRLDKADRGVKNG